MRCCECRGAAHVGGWRGARRGERPMKLRKGGRIRPMPPVGTNLPVWLDETQQRAEMCLARAARAIDERYGVIRTVQVLPTEPDDPRLFHAAAEAANCGPLFGHANFGLNGGAGHTPETALDG